MTLVKLRGLSAGKCSLLSEAMLRLAIATLSLKILPFRRVVAFGSLPLQRLKTRESDEATIAGVGWAIQACARRVPWRAKCFDQGLAAAWMLQRRGIAATLHYGIARDEELRLVAHVWVRAKGQDVIGCEVEAKFTEIAQFPDQIQSSLRLNSRQCESPTSSSRVAF